MSGLLHGLLLLGFVAACVGFGYFWAHDKLTVTRTELEQQRQALDAEWAVLDQTRRIRAVLLGARHAMHEEARRATSSSQEGQSWNEK